MDKLARGIDPITDQEIADDSVLNNVRLARCFYYVSDALGKIIANGGNVGAAPKLQPFAIRPEQLGMVQLSPEPVRVTQLVDMIFAAVDDPGMRKLGTTVITNWLLEKGFLEKQVTPEGKSKRVPTAGGMAIGLSTETGQGQYGEYMAVLHNMNAQRFVLDHLMEMLQ